MEHLDRAIRGACRNYTSGNRQAALQFVCFHKTHLHVVHDCTYTSSTCRCAFTRNIQDELGVRYTKRWVIRQYRFGSERVYNTLLYFQKTGRQALYIQIGGRIWRHGCEIGPNPLFGGGDKVQEGLVERGEFADNGDLSAEFGIGDCDRGLHESNHGPLPESTSGTTVERYSLPKAILVWLRQHPAAPLTSILQTRHWSESKFGTKVLRTAPLLTNLFNNYALELMDASMVELFERYSSLEHTNLIFAAPLGNIQETYYTLDESVVILEKLLLYQYRDDTEIVEIFLQDLYDVLEKRIAKKNTFFVLSPSNAGKNFFFDCIVHFYLNFGLIGNFNKYQNFPLQECVHKRILLWNEPQAEPSAFETLKTLLGGDQTVVRVKYQGDATVGRTPVIILSNHNIFPNDAAFVNRMFVYEWRTAPYLAQYRKKPHPMATYLLFKKYKIIKPEM
uniref:Non-structural protein 1 n=2 Tax=Diaphorina citri densovirus TaxID=1776153 RepID=A0A0U3SIS5_9VIRU|nr:non-structural protein 1 [Diaphorina citri densovirus]